MSGSVETIILNAVGDTADEMDAGTVMRVTNALLSQSQQNPATKGNGG